MADPLLDRFLSLCAIPAPSGREGAMAERLRCELAAMGLAVTEDDAGRRTGGECGNLFAERPPLGPARRWVTLFSHMDAVPPGYCEGPYLDGDIVRSRGGILAADDRAGVAIALHILDELGREPLAGVGVQVVFTVSEEAGVGGAEVLDRELVKGEWAVVLDTGGRPGQINTASPDGRKFRCRFEGRAAHAGNAPEKGVNALLIAARAVAALPSGRLNPDTTFSVTIMKSGEATNVIPAEAVIEGEVRSFKEGEAERLLALLRSECEAAAESGGGKVTISDSRLFPPFHLHDSHPLVAGLVRASLDCGFEPEPRRTGGGSDANPLNFKGIPAVNVAVGYRDAHSPSEHLLVHDFKGTFQWVLKFLRNLDA